MSRFFGLINLVSLIYLSSLLIWYTTYAAKDRDEWEMIKLSMAIDYASVAAAEAMLGSAHLGMDYKARNAFAIDPKLALDTFLEVFCFNYNLYPTEANLAYVKDFIPVAAVAAYDGYYMATRQLVRNGNGPYPEMPVGDADWDLVFGMKRPYSHEFAGTHYALTMGLDETWVLSGSVLSKIQGLPPVGGGTMSKQEARQLINDTLMREMGLAINQANESNPNWKYAFYIPGQMTTFTKVNPIERPGFIILVQHVNIATPRPISGFSVAGSSVGVPRYLAGFTRNGVNQYAYADQLPAGVAAEMLFSTPEEAASAGYYAAIDLMGIN